MRDEIKKQIIDTLPEGYTLHANPGGWFTVENQGWVEGALLHTHGRIIQGDDDGVYLTNADIHDLMVLSKNVDAGYFNLAVETEDTLAITWVPERTFRCRRHNGHLYSRVPLRAPSYIAIPGREIR